MWQPCKQYKAHPSKNLHAIYSWTLAMSIPSQQHLFYSFMQPNIATTCISSFVYIFILSSQSNVIFCLQNICSKFQAQQGMGNGHGKEYLFAAHCIIFRLQIDKNRLWNCDFYYIVHIAVIDKTWIILSTIFFFFVKLTIADGINVKKLRKLELNASISIRLTKKKE